MGNPFSKSNRVEPLLPQEGRRDNQEIQPRLTIRQRLLCLDSRVAPANYIQEAVRAAEVGSAASTPNNANASVAAEPTGSIEAAESAVSNLQQQPNAEGNSVSIQPLVQKIPLPDIGTTPKVINVTEASTPVASEAAEKSNAVSFLFSLENPMERSPLTNFPAVIPKRLQKLSEASTEASNAR